MNTPQPNPIAESVAKATAPAVDQLAQKDAMHQMQLHAAEVATNAMLSEFAAQRDALSERCVKLASEIGGLQMALKSGQGMIKQLSDTAKAKTEEAAALQQTINEQNAKLATLRARVAELEKDLPALVEG
jgi:chromosome segregation ATPase